MNLELDGVKSLIQDLISKEKDLGDGVEVIVCPSMPFLALSAELLKGHERIKLGAQNCFHQNEGAFTGESSPAQLKSIGVEYCLVGHSERREYFNEDYKELHKKTKALLDNGLTPIFCCGEQLQVRDSNVYKEFILNQLELSLFELTADEMMKVVIAYEPIWAIGTGKTATAAQAQEMHELIRTRLSSQYGEKVSSEISILYGGSCKGENAGELFSQKDIDGGLIGGASLDADGFVAISKSF